jgi:hypothetical protein
MLNMFVDRERVADMHGGFDFAQLLRTSSSADEQELPDK